MSEPAARYGVLVAVDGSPSSDAAIRWAGRDAEMRGVPITLMHVVVPVMVSWPVGALQGSFSQWQEENAQNVINQAQKTLQADFDVPHSQRCTPRCVTGTISPSCTRPGTHR